MFDHFWAYATLKSKFMLGLVEQWLNLHFMSSGLVQFKPKILAHLQLWLNLCDGAPLFSRLLPSLP